MNDVVCCVLTSFSLDERIQRIEKTWGKDIPTIFYSDHSDNTRKIIKVSDQSDYWSAEDKQMNVINMIQDGLENILTNYKWICFCDDDTFINTRVVYEEIDYFNQQCIYGSIVDHPTNPSNLIYTKPGIPLKMKYPSGGAGFFVSTHLLKLVGKFKNYGTRYSDVGVGMNCYHKKISLINHELFCSNTPTIHKHTDDVIKSKLSYHYIKTDSDMEHLYSFTK